jgi:hypothetical protein
LRAGSVPEADARFFVILLRAAVAAFFPLRTAFFAVDFERFITAAAPTASAPAMAGKILDMLILQLTKPEEAQYGHNNDDEADEIDYAVHAILL